MICCKIKLLNMWNSLDSPLTDNSKLAKNNSEVRKTLLYNPQVCTITTVWVCLCVPSGTRYWLIYVHNGSCTLLSVDFQLTKIDFASMGKWGGPKFTKQTSIFMDYCMTFPVFQLIFNKFTSLMKDRKCFTFLRVINIWASLRENLSSRFRQSKFQISFLSYRD